MGLKRPRGGNIIGHFTNNRRGVTTTLSLSLLLRGVDKWKKTTMNKIKMHVLPLVVGVLSFQVADQAYVNIVTTRCQQRAIARHKISCSASPAPGTAAILYSPLLQVWPQPIKTLLTNYTSASTHRISKIYIPKYAGTHAYN